jgi:glycosyltransferase involved in cell wall biosynthesis
MKIGIIDPVGIKAGMNCYDIGLLSSLKKANVNTYCFSNFYNEKYKHVAQFKYFLDVKKNALLTTSNFVISHLKALMKCNHEKVDWIILHVFSATAKDYFSFLSVKTFGLRIIAIVHDVKSLSKADNDFFRKKLYELADLLIVHNKTSKKTIETKLSEKDKKKVHVISHGNYIEFIHSHDRTDYFKELLTFDSSNRYLLFFGQIKKAKGLDILLKSIPFLPPNIKVIIAGRPYKEDFAYYEDIIQQLKVEDRVIKIIRFISDEERDFLFKNCDALVLPYREIFQSGVLLLSMSYGVPVIASDLPANEEIIAHGENGILFQNENAEDLAKKTKQLFSMDMTKIKQNAFDTVKNEYCWSKISQEYFKIFTEQYSKHAIKK